MKYAPVIIPTLCRREHFIRLVESLKNNSWAQYTEIFVGLDYPPSDKYRKGWELICKYVEDEDFSQFKSFNVFRRSENYGAERNTKDLMEYVLKQYDRYIYCEDDLEVSPNFLEYMDKCLDKYEDDPDVIAVSGYCYPVQWEVSKEANCFKQYFCASMWGIGWWKSKYEKVERNIISGDMLKRGRFVIKSKRHFRMIDNALTGYVPAVSMPFKIMNKWMLCVCDMSVRSYLVVYDNYIISPVVSKVRNHGFDGSGLYCDRIDEEENGNTALTYNYSKQPIDKETIFEIQMDDRKALKVNRDLLNRFDFRSQDQLIRTRRLLWLFDHFGLCGAQLYSICCLPADIIKRLLTMTINGWRKNSSV